MDQVIQHQENKNQLLQTLLDELNEGVKKKYSRSLIPPTAMDPLIKDNPNAYYYSATCSVSILASPTTNTDSIPIIVRLPEPVTQQITLDYGQSSTSLTPIKFPN